MKIKEIFRENTIAEERWMLQQKLFQSYRNYFNLLELTVIGIKCL